MELTDKIEMPAPTADIVDRVRYLMKFSRLTQAEFAKKIGIDAGNLSRILSRRVPVTNTFSNKIIVNLGVNKDWLISGTDLPFGVTHRKTERPKGAPVYDIDVTAGCMPLSRMFTNERIIGFCDMPGINPEYPLVRVTGDSMEPRLASGCYISVRPISLNSPISWGNIYVVVLEDYRLVKYVRRNSDSSLVTLHSANPMYDDMEIRRADIQALFLVESVINYEVVS